MLRFTPRAALALGLTLTLLLVGVGARADRASATTPQDEQVFVGLINNLRAQKGLAALEVHPELATLARAWTATMSANDQLSHSPDISAGLSAPWTVLGENVGVHGIHDINQLFQAFVNSPAHYQNLVDPRFNYVGVGVVNTGSGTLWTTHRFMAAEIQAPAQGTTIPPLPTTTTTTAAPPATIAPATSAPITAPPTTEPKPSTTAASQPSTTIVSTTQQPNADAPATTAAGTDEQSTATSGTASQANPASPAPPDEPDVETVEQVLMELVNAGI